MLGEQIGEFQGRLLNRRDLPPDMLGPREEIILQETGKLLTFEVRNTLVFISIIRPGGIFYREGHIRVTTEDGDEAVGQLLGTLKPNRLGMGGNLCCAVHFDAASHRLMWLKDVIGYWEAEQDSEGNTQAKLWKWGLGTPGDDLPLENWPALGAMAGRTSKN